MHKLKRVASISAMVFALFVGLSAATPASSKPNIILIVADDLGYGDLGVTGCPDIKTPNIDRLASEGVRFRNAYANGAVCSPTRTALLTGRYQQRLGVDRVIYADEQERGLTLKARLLPEALAVAGYRSAIIGKWHLGYPKQYFPTRQGFDEFLGFVAGNIDYFIHTDRLDNHDLWRNEDEIRRDGQYFTQLIADEAIRFLDRYRESPFFLYLPFNAPHDPFQGPEDAATAGDQHVTRRVNRTRAVYRKMVESLDHNVGRVLEQVRKTDLEANTAVFFMSDNGGVADVARNAPFRGSKGTLWEGGIRSPLIAKWRGEFSSGRLEDEPVAGMDLFPTLLAMAGIQIPGGDELDGVNLLPLLRGESTLAREGLYFHYRAPGQSAQRALVENGWKYLRDNQEKVYLFHLSQDQGEQSDLAEQHPERLSRMKSKYETWRREVFRNAVPEPER